jgi:hypothetical protein
VVRNEQSAKPITAVYHEVITAGDAATAKEQLALAEMLTDKLATAARAKVTLPDLRLVQ